MIDIFKAYVNNSDRDIISYSCLDEINGLLLIANNDKGNLKLTEWLRFNREFLVGTIYRHGGVLLRGFDIHSLSEFNQCVKFMSPELLDYKFRSTPRKRLGGNIFTATEYPENRTILMHNENSYTKNWPRTLFFFNLIAPEEGGETPIVDSRRVYEKISSDIRDKFESKNLLYVRNYHENIDLSWQEVFQTDSKNMVNDYCKINNIECQWNSTGSMLTTRELCQSSLLHPIVNQMVWFNQAHLFHPSSLSEDDLKCLTANLGLEYLPRNVFYGDGSPIELDSLNHIRDIYNSEKLMFRWHKGDLMILDNILLAHGRQPFKGHRKVVVAMTGEL